MNISSIRIMFWGTGGAVTPKGAEQPCIAVKIADTVFLLDVGERCQKALECFHLGVNSPLYIFVTHLHSDHYSGLIPLLETLSLLGRERALSVYGPPGLGSVVTGRRTTGYPVSLTELYGREGILRLPGLPLTVSYVAAPHSYGALSYIIRVEDKVRLDEEKLEQEKIPPALRKELLEKGKVRVGSKEYSLNSFVKQVVRGVKISYTGDSLPSHRFASKAMESDVLIHDSTLLKRDWYRKPYMAHSTVEDAVAVFKATRSRLLVLTHFSAMYRNPAVDLSEAVGEYPRVLIAEKGLTIDVAFTEPRVFSVRINTDCI